MNMCLEPFRLKGTQQYVNCGRCRACRLSRRLEWTNRLSHEACFHNHKVLFVTLTYRNEDLPENFSLSVRDLQLFFKRLRKRLWHKYDGAPPTVRYFAAGEYGDKTKRPHYHVILYGLSMSHANMIYEAWGKSSRGHFDCRTVMGEKAYGYVAGYTVKKMAQKEYGKRKSPFLICSQGIGKRYAILYADQLKQRPVLRKQGKEYLIPRYYRKVLEIDDISGYIKEKQENLVSIVGRLYNLTEMSARAVVNFNGAVMKEIRKACDSRLEARENEWRHKNGFLG